MRCQPSCLLPRFTVVCLSFGMLLMAASVSATSLGELPKQVTRTLERFDLQPTGLSVRVESVDSGEVILDFQSDVRRNPASTMKLVTTYAALSTLNPGYVWHTDVILDGELTDGVLRGDLQIRGGGDPYLVQETLWQMLSELRRRGLQTIDGDLVFDKSLFAVPDNDPAAFDNEPLRAYNVGPDALLTNFKVIQFWFEPSANGRDVQISTSPVLPNLTIDNALSVKPGRCRGYQRGIRIDAQPKGDTVRFSGEFPAGCKRYAMGRTLLSHDQYTFGLFKSVWQQLGGDITGGFRHAVTDSEADVFLRWQSRPFSEIVRLINKHSNNVMTRQVFLTLGLEMFEAPATVEKARAAVTQWADAQGLTLDGLVIDNGSGLSRQARMTPRAMTELLRDAWRSPFMPEFVASLSLVGIDGTFRRRHKRDSLKGRAHLKTGRLDDVTAMAGYVMAEDGRRYIVAVMHNDLNVHRGAGEAVQDAVLRWVYRYEPDEPLLSATPTSVVPREAGGSQ
ncbi:MAG: D-alanyl-D-alanine carboxypeptidase/D-alanyl-D-alanine-endopeptidase [Pseudomonadota bacterium]